MQEAQKYFKTGRYDKCIYKLRQLRNEGRVTFEVDSLLYEAYLKGNYSDEVPFHLILMIQTMLTLQNQKLFVVYFTFIQQSSVGQALLAILREQKIFERNPLDMPKVKLIINKQDNLEKQEDLFPYLSSTDRPVFVFPVVWPIAFGDFTVIQQYIKRTKEQNPNAFIILIAPLNRTELSELTALNDSLDVIYDITLMEEEKDRLKSLWLMNNRMLNVSWQERIITNLLTQIKDLNNKVTIIKTRYLPMLNNFEYKAGWRIWEERARLFLSNGEELPKLLKEKGNKKKKIVVHFREGDYGDQARNMNPHQAQDLISELAETYSDYEIVRLGDNKMTPMVNCTDLALEEDSNTLERQIKEIQEAALFIGTHSAPQMLAVAVSNTPVICTNYTAQETYQDVNDKIAQMSYEPIGKQVKAILYTRMFDQAGKEVLPTQNNRNMFKFEHPTNDEVMAEVKKVLK